MSHLFIQKVFVCLLLLLLILSPVLLSAMCTFYNFTDFNIYTILKRRIVQLIIIQLIKNGKSTLIKDPCPVLFNSMEK